MDSVIYVYGMWSSAESAVARGRGDRRAGSIAVKEERSVRRTDEPINSFVGGITPVSEFEEDMTSLLRRHRVSPK